MTWLWDHVTFQDEMDADRLADAVAVTFRDMPLWHLNGKTSDDLLKPRTAAQAKTSSQASTVVMPTVPLANKKVGRNDLCPCGSGKKFKHCCGKGQ